MKLKAPPGVGDPCVAGVTVSSRDGIYEVEAEIGALLMESFGFFVAESDGEITEQTKSAPATRRTKLAARKA
jgi:hypothetical protein